MKFNLRRAFGGLAFRVAALLALALLPIGMIAVYQTDKIEVELARRDEAALLALTAEAASAEERLIRAAFGSLSAFAAAFPQVKAIPNACDKIFADFVAANPQFSFAGYVSRDGIVSCGSAGKGTDFSAYRTYIEMLADPKPQSVVNMQAPISKTSVITMSNPIMTTGAFDGYVTISLPHSQIGQGIELLSPLRPLELITFNELGEVLSAEGGLEAVTSHLPQFTPLRSLAGGRPKAFSGFDGLGKPRVFAVVPVLENNVYAIGSWSPAEVGGTSALPSLVFPALMWLTSFAVAYLAVHRLAIKHIRRLGGDIEQFERTGYFSPAKSTFGMPAEMRDIDISWHRLAETVVSDRTKLQDVIRDKTVLLQEVHHRVKNNLQLISSIISLKTRAASTAEAKLALKGVQARVMSMATVHRALYETTTESRVRADELLRGIVRSILEVGATTSLPIAVQQFYDPVTLYPDQAVPLSLLASEALTNALKYSGHALGNPPSLAIRLALGDNSTAFFEVENSKGIKLISADQSEGTGLGSALIAAFAEQIGGTIQIIDEPDRYWLRLDFPIVNFQPAPVDAFIMPAD